MTPTQQWTQQVGDQVYYISLEDNGILIGEHRGSGQSDHATYCSFKRFLAGEFDSLIAQRFGAETLQTILAAVHQIRGQYDLNQE